MLVINPHLKLITLLFVLCWLVAALIYLSILFVRHAVCEPFALLHLNIESGKKKKCTKMSINYVI